MQTQSDIAPTNTAVPAPPAGLGDISKVLPEQSKSGLQARVLMAKSPLQKGYRLQDAKRELGNATFQEMLGSGKFGVDRHRAAMLTEIAANPVLINPQYHRSLPGSRTALSELAATLEIGIRAAAINPMMTAAQASDFARKHRDDVAC